MDSTCVRQAPNYDSQYSVSKLQAEDTQAAEARNKRPFASACRATLLFPAMNLPAELTRLLREVPAGACTLYCLHMKLRGAEGAPARTVVEVPE